MEELFYKDSGYLFDREHDILHVHTRKDQIVPHGPPVVSSGSCDVDCRKCKERFRVGGGFSLNLVSLLYCTTCGFTSVYPGAFADPDSGWAKGRKVV